MVLIRKMGEEDIGQVSEVMCSCYRWLGRVNGYMEGQIDYLLSERGSVATIRSESQGQKYLVACLNDVIVGVAVLKGNEVAKLYVDPEFHGQGIGRALFESAEQVIIEGGFEDVIVGVHGQSAIGFYEKMGMSVFETKVVIEGVFSGCEVPVMRKHTACEPEGPLYKKMKLWVL